jgi:signal transduction histidine kinase
MNEAGTPLLALIALGLMFARVQRLRGRLERVARAEHELRGAATALGLVCQSWRRMGPASAPSVDAIEFQLDRLCAGLADLDAARGGRRSPPGHPAVDLRRFLDASLVPWRSAALAPGSVVPALQLSADRGRLAQALGNLLANAAEHGRGPAELRTQLMPFGVRVEVRNERGPLRRGGPGRGRGLAIADQATRELGGSLRVRVEGDHVVAALDLPGQAPRAA